jgi:sterol desaturase/sphingolipid hydroxylase (fatty acid hydroxylase superfamily)
MRNAMTALEDLLFTIKPVALAVMLAFFVAERLRPAVAQTPDGRRLARNLSLWAGNIVLSLAVVVPVTVIAAEHGLGWRPEWWAGTGGLLLDLLILDLWIYAWHRMNHEIPFLWRFHEVHHRDQTLDVSTAVRFHPGEVFLSALVRVPVILALGMPLVSVVVFEALVLMAAAFQHSNLALAPWLERGLSRVIVTPGIHWVHHHDRRADTDSNYATVLSLWDRLFGSRSATARTPAMSLGVEGRDELSLIRLALLPFANPSR